MLRLGPSMWSSRPPAVAGAVFAAADPGGPPLTQVRAGDHVIVRVDPGAFEPRTKVTLSFVDSSGRTYVMRIDHASVSGSLDTRAVIPQQASPGQGQVFAQSEGNGAEFDRTWLLMVIP